MHRARVLIVDDSRTMRALFSGLLERDRDIEVVGMAASADEAREKIADLKPNVLTLDVEMPGMSGLEFLEEIMSTQPMPVIMLSAITQEGAETFVKALELGAVTCFPKPLHASPAVFDRLAKDFTALVLAAANGQIKSPRRAVAPEATIEAAAPAEADVVLDAQPVADCGGAS